MKLPKIIPRGKTYQEPSPNSLDKLILEQNQTREKDISVIYKKIEDIKYDAIEENKNDIKKVLEKFDKIKIEKDPKKFNNIVEMEEDEKNKKEINDKVNFIKIYLDFLNIYQEEIVKNPMPKILEKIVNDELYKKEMIEKNLELFDILCKRIKMNLFVNIGDETFSNLFFQNLKPPKLIFFIRFYMIRIFMDIIRGEKKINKFSIINQRNIISKELLSNIITKIIKKSDDFTKKEELLKSQMVNSFVNNVPSKMEQNEKQIEIIKKDFIKNELKYFDILLDYVFFEKNYIYDIRKKQNNNNANDKDKKKENIFDKYITYYERLSVFNNDSYSYIYEHKGHQNEMNYSDQLDKWNKLIKEEYQNEGL